MTLVEAVALCREKTTDLPGASNVNWRNDDTDLICSNADWTGYLEQARTEYCHRRPVRDSASALTSVTVTGGGDGVVTLDPAILYVDRVFSTGAEDSRILTKTDQVELDRTFARWWEETGDPRYYLDDEAEHQIRVLPVPASDVVLNLTVRRLPVTPLDWANRNDPIADVATQDHVILSEWACGQARLKDDELIYNKKASDAHFALFERQLGPRPNPRLRDHIRYVANRRPRTRGYY